MLQRLLIREISFQDDNIMIDTDIMKTVSVLPALARCMIMLFL